MTPDALRLWVTMRAPESYWRRSARDTIAKVIRAHPELLDDNAALLKAVDASYPFGERTRLPYKMWLLERRLFRNACAVPAAGIVGLEAEVCSVARDELELHPERAVEIRRILDEQAPHRLGRECPACGARPGIPCAMAPPTPQGIVVRMTVPHHARLVSHLDAGPLFGGAP